MKKLFLIILLLSSTVLLAEPIKRHLLCIWSADLDKEIRPEMIAGVAKVSDVTVICSSNRAVSKAWFFYFCADNVYQLQSKMTAVKTADTTSKITAISVVGKDEKTEKISTNKMAVILTDNPAEELNGWMKNH
jgi:hypothetical protein